MMAKNFLRSTSTQSNKMLFKVIFGNQKLDKMLFL